MVAVVVMGLLPGASALIVNRPLGGEAAIGLALAVFAAAQLFKSSRS